MISSPKPPELAELLLKLQASSINQQEQRQLAILVQRIDEHLAKVAKPLYSPAKGRGQNAPIFAFGASNASKARDALSHVFELQNALNNEDFGAALVAAKEIDDRGPQ